MLRTICVVMCAASGVNVQAVVLYDASTGDLPSERGWAYLTSPLLGAEATQHVADGTLLLDTSRDISEMAGYFGKVPLFQLEHPNHPTLDLDLYSVSVRFTLRQSAGEDRLDTDPLALGQRNRGGFAVIAIGEDLRGIELQLQSDTVITLGDDNTAFPIGEELAFDTTDAMRDYELILGVDGYHLWANDVPLLQGPLRNYQDVAPSPPFNFPYTTSSFLFFGDNTGRAGAVTHLTRFEVLPLSPTGECSGDGLLGVEDLACIRTVLQRNALLASLNTVPGDLNGDRHVDFVDFVMLANSFGAQIQSYSRGNVDLQRGVDFADFVELASNFGTIASDVQSVPESNSAMTICLVATIFVRHIRRHRQTLVSCYERCPLRNREPQFLALTKH